MSDEIIIGQCSCCHFNDIPVKSYTRQGEYQIRHNTLPEPRLLCELCSHTHIGTMTIYPSQCVPGTIDTATSNAWMVNRLLQEIRRDSFNIDEIVALLEKVGFIVKKLHGPCHLISTKPNSDLEDSHIATTKARWADVLEFLFAQAMSNLNRV